MLATQAWHPEFDPPEPTEEAESLEIVLLFPKHTEAHAIERAWAQLNADTSGHK